MVVLLQSVIEMRNAEGMIIVRGVFAFPLLSASPIMIALRA